MLNAQERKERPLARGVLDYFPDALMEVAHTSFIGNEQHNPGQPLHWAKGKSTDEADALLRHLKDRGTIDTDGVRHSAKVAWRALAMLQREIEAERELVAAEGNAVLDDLEDFEQMMVDDSQSALATDLNVNIDKLVKMTTYVDVDHGSDNGELPQPHGSRPSHYEGDFGSLAIDPDSDNRSYRP